MDKPKPLPLLKPMLAKPSAPFDHPDYLFEVKWDGYRCLAYLDRQGTTLRSRNLKNISDVFPDLGDLHLYAQHFPLILDGEIIVFEDGKPSFNALQSRARVTARNRVLRAAQKTPAIYMAFDILYYCGKPLLLEPLSTRRKHLTTTFRQGPNFSLSEQFAMEGVAFFQACVQRGLEGMVAKKSDSKYLPGIRSPLWKKVRYTREADLVICGYRRGKGS